MLAKLPLPAVIGVFLLTATIAVTRTTATTNTTPTAATTTAKVNSIANAATTFGKVTEVTRSGNGNGSRSRNTSVKYVPIVSQEVKKSNSEDVAELGGGRPAETTTSLLPLQPPLNLTSTTTSVFLTPAAGSTAIEHQLPNSTQPQQTQSRGTQSSPRMNSKHQDTAKRSSQIRALRKSNANAEQANVVKSDSNTLQRDSTKKAHSHISQLTPAPVVEVQIEEEPRKHDESPAPSPDSTGYIHFDVSDEDGNTRASATPTRAARMETVNEVLSNLFPNGFTDIFRFSYASEQPTPIGAVATEAEEPRKQPTTTAAPTIETILTPAPSSSTTTTTTTAKPIKTQAQTFVSFQKSVSKEYRRKSRPGHTEIVVEKLELLPHSISSSGSGEFSDGSNLITKDDLLRINRAAAEAPVLPSLLINPSPKQDNNTATANRSSNRQAPIIILNDDDSADMEGISAEDNLIAESQNVGQRLYQQLPIDDKPNGRREGGVRDHAHPESEVSIHIVHGEPSYLAASINGRPIFVPEEQQPAPQEGDAKRATSVRRYEAVSPAQQLDKFQEHAEQTFHQQNLVQEAPSRKFLRNFNPILSAGAGTSTPSGTFHYEAHSLQPSYYREAAEGSGDKEQKQPPKQLQDRGENSAKNQREPSVVSAEQPKSLRLPLQHYDKDAAQLRYLKEQQFLQQQQQILQQQQQFLLQQQQQEQQRQQHERLIQQQQELQRQEKQRQQYEQQQQHEQQQHQQQQKQQQAEDKRQPQYFPPASHTHQQKQQELQQFHKELQQQHEQQQPPLQQQYALFQQHPPPHEYRQQREKQQQDHYTKQRQQQQKEQEEKTRQKQQQQYEKQVRQQHEDQLRQQREEQLRQQQQQAERLKQQQVEQLQRLEAQKQQEQLQKPHQDRQRQQQQIPQRQHNEQSEQQHFSSPSKPMQPPSTLNTHTAGDSEPASASLEHRTYQHPLDAASQHSAPATPTPHSVVFVTLHTPTSKTSHEHEPRPSFAQRSPYEYVSKVAGTVAQTHQPTSAPSTPAAIVKRPQGGYTFVEVQKSVNIHNKLITERDGKLVEEHETIYPQPQYITHQSQVTKVQQIAQPTLAPHSQQPLQHQPPEQASNPQATYTAEVPYPHYPYAEQLAVLEEGVNPNDYYFVPKEYASLTSNPINVQHIDEAEQQEEASSHAHLQAYPQQQYVQYVSHYAQQPAEQQTSQQPVDQKRVVPQVAKETHEEHHKLAAAKETAEKVVEDKVEKIVERPVHIPYPVHVQQYIDRPYPVQEIVETHIPVPYPVPEPVPVPVHVDRYIDRPYPVEKIVEKRVPYPVEKVVEKIVEKEIPVEIEKIVEKVVDRPVPVPIRVPVAVPVPYAHQSEPAVYDEHAEIFGNSPYHTHPNSLVWNEPTSFADFGGRAPVMQQIPPKVLQNYYARMLKKLLPKVLPQRGALPASAPTATTVAYTHTQARAKAPAASSTTTTTSFKSTKPQKSATQSSSSGKQHSFKIGDMRFDLKPPPPPPTGPEWSKGARYIYNTLPHDLSVADSSGSEQLADAYTGPYAPPNEPYDEFERWRNGHSLKRSPQFGRNLQMEYGFKPPLVPSVEINDQGIPLHAEEKKAE